MKIKTRIEIKKVCLLNGNQPITSNLHKLSALLSQHAISMETRTQQPNFGLDGFPRMLPYAKLTKLVVINM